MSTPSLLLGRSRTCPLEARTSNPEPRYLPIVRALAGDSTMTRFFPRRAGFTSSGVSAPAGAFEARTVAGFLDARAAAGALGTGGALTGALALVFLAAFALVSFLGSVTSVRCLGRARIERDPMLLVEPMDQDLGCKLLRLGLAVDRGTFLA